MLRNLLPFIPYDFEGRQVCCPACGSASNEQIARMDRRLKPLRTVICRECGLFYSNPMPTEAELARYYRDEYRNDYQFARLRPPKRHVEKKTAEARQRYAVLTGELGADRRIAFFDFGCGSGELVHELARQGHDAVGLEPGASYSEFARESGGGSCRIDNCTFEEADYSEGAFDVITMLHVLEHLPDSLKALERVHRWLRDDGIFYVEVPDMQDYALKGFEHFHFAHVVGFSRDNLIHVLHRAGFAVHRELSPTSLLAKKAGSQPDRDKIDLASTYARNSREYGQGISLGAYLSHHALRGLRRLRKLW